MVCAVSVVVLFLNFARIIKWVFSNPKIIFLKFKLTDTVHK